MSNKIDLDTPIVVSGVMLEKIQYRAGITLGASVCRDATISIEELPIFDQVFVDLQTKLLAQEICQDTYRVSDVKTVSYPASWWQHFKQDKMPKWFTRR